MILVDSSVWIDHLRAPVLELEIAIGQDRIMIHPFVIAELAMGWIPQRCEFLARLADLAPAPLVTNQSFLRFVEQNQLHETGLGMVDSHLLASANEVRGIQLWARDKRLGAHAERLGFAYSEGA